MPEVQKDRALHCLRSIGEQPCQILREKALMAEPIAACGGHSIVDDLWGKLDACIDLLMDEETKKKERRRLQEQARVLTYVIALMTNPYYPDEEGIGDLAMARYEARQDPEQDPDEEEEA